MTDASPRCPKCTASVTRAHSIRYQLGTRTVSYQCNECRHTWRITEHTDAKLQSVSSDG
jgi:membrane-bound inhibitor of C-type lysozyme